METTRTAIIFTLAIVATFSWIVGYYFGECRGIKDTEERWSNAIAIKAARDRVAALDRSQEAK